MVSLPVLKERVIEQVRNIVPPGTKEYNNMSSVRFSYYYKGADITVTVNEVRSVVGFAKTSDHLLKVTASARLGKNKLYGNTFGISSDGKWGHQTLKKRLREAQHSLDFRERHEDRVEKKQEDFIKRIERELGVYGNAKWNSKGKRNFVEIKQHGIELSIFPDSKNKIKEITFRSNKPFTFDQTNSLLKVFRK